MTARFTVPDDPVALRMENDLLALENEHLRGWLTDCRAGMSADLERVRDELETTKRSLATANLQLDEERERGQELARARSDLRWLLQRLDASPARVLLRRFAGYRTLVARWLDA